MGNLYGYGPVDGPIICVTEARASDFCGPHVTNGGYLGEQAGVPTVGVATVPWPLVQALGLVVPFMRELRETRHQFAGPFVVDWSAFITTFGQSRRR